MNNITKSVHITNTPNYILNYIINIKNHPNFILALESITEPNGDPRTPGTSWTWTFTMSGVRINGTAHTVNFEKDHIFSYQTKGDLESLFTYTTVPENGGTRLTITVEYEMPTTVLKKVTEKLFIKHINEFVTAQAAKNLHDILSE